MPASLELFNDTWNVRLVRGVNNAEPVSLPSFFQGDTISIRYYPLLPLDQARAPFFEKIDLTSLTLQLVIGPRAGADDIKAAQYTWTKQIGADAQGKSGYLYADLDLNTSGLNTALATADTFSSFLEFKLSEGGKPYRTVFQGGITIFSTVKDPTSPASVPTPAASYLTRDECFELFVMWKNTLRAGNAGRTVELVSQDTASTRELGVANDKSAIDNLT
jgi:hypothetical protein